MKKVMGRPRKAAHRAKVFRFARIEDEILNVVDKMKDQEDKKMVLDLLENLKK